MLELKNIYKSYTTGEFTQAALDGLSLTFRKNEFVAILGPSGSGKTTCLNVIGGLDRYESGDLQINGKSTRHFTDREWDAYRNNSIGFVFQNYHLIPHLTVLENVAMGMTLSGVHARVRNKKAREVLKRVGLSDHMHKKPNQLSGGQAQRVAIARALSNNPDIILADEPTGALDSTSSRQIMELIREVAADKLVIMVTHNAKIAETYADRIVQFEDGRVTADNNPPPVGEPVEEYHLKKTSMSFLAALKLSGRNILTKKWRTGLTAFASSIGIIGISLILSLSNGFNEQINQFERSTLSGFPLIISQNAMNMDPEAIEAQHNQFHAGTRYEQYPDIDYIIPREPITNTLIHTNVFTPEYIDYIEAMNPKLVSGISYTRLVNMNLLMRNEGEQATAVNMAAAEFTAYPRALAGDEAGYVKQNYDLLAGSFPENKTDLLLVISNSNRLDVSVLRALGIDTEAKEIPFADLIGREYKLILNDQFYSQAGEMFVPNAAGGLDALYDNEDAVTLTICGIIRAKEAYILNILPNGIVYSDALSDFLLENAKDSEIVRAQTLADHNLLNGEAFAKEGEGSDGGTGSPLANMGGSSPMTGLASMQSLMSMFSGRMSVTKTQLLKSLGADGTPMLITLYPTDFASKDAICSYLNEWNDQKPVEENVIYMDLADTFANLSGNIMDAITVVLVAFAGISLVVSLIMIGIITYISVLERTKEIGILRALGARKKDITRVFNAETFIIGTCSGLLGVGIGYLLTLPVNVLLLRLTELENVARLNPLHAAVLFVLSVSLTLLGGTIPARLAAKKDPVEALRTE